jgi:phospholipid-translocating ATPase
VLGAFDQDVDARHALAFPQLYKRGILGKEYTRTVFWLFILDGIYQSIVACTPPFVFLSCVSISSLTKRKRETDFIPYFIFKDNTSISFTGHESSGEIDFGTTVAAGAVISANLFTGLHIRYWTWMVTAIIVFSSLAFFVWVAIYSAFPYNFSGITLSLFGTFNFWVRP